MEKINNHHQENVNPSLLLLPANKEESPKKLIGVGVGVGGGGSNDRLKRDEWSEGAVSCLLEAYEAKWVLRNRAKLKGHDWEEVARYVSARGGGDNNNTKSPKTQTQCKNKIESMKKRYRSESANADGSSWLLYPRLDLLLRGSNNSPQQQQQKLQHHHHQPLNSPLILIEPSPSPAAAPPPPPPPPPPPQNSHGSNGVDHITAKEDGEGTKLSDHVSSDKKVMMMDTDSSTPAALYSDNNEKMRSEKLKMKMEANKKKKRKREEEWEIAESIRWLAEVVVRSEQARMETMKEIEKMRAEAEAKRGELDLKRTEIIANTQLEIAKLFAANAAKGVDSSLRIGRN